FLLYLLPCHEAVALYRERQPPIVDGGLQLLIDIGQQPNASTVGGPGDWASQRGAGHVTEHKLVGRRITQNLRGRMNRDVPEVCGGNERTEFLGTAKSERPRWHEPACLRTNTARHR